MKAADGAIRSKTVLFVGQVVGQTGPQHCDPPRILRSQPLLSQRVATLARPELDRGGPAPNA